MKQRMIDLLEGWAASMGLNKIYGEFDNEDQAAGFARGLTYDDSSLGEVFVVEHKASGKWFVIFRDHNYDDDTNEVAFSVNIDVTDYGYNNYEKVEL